MPTCLTGVTAELPFGARTSQLRLLPDSDHPLLGKGLLVLLTLPLSGVSVAQALELNRCEMLRPTRTALLGTWVADDVGPTFAAFYPNAVHREGLALNAVIGTMVRACWVAASLLGEGWARGSATALERMSIRASRNHRGGGR